MGGWVIRGMVCGLLVAELFASVLKMHIGPDKRQCNYLVEQVQQSGMLPCDPAEML
jgi:hypothetical protein